MMIFTTGRDAFLYAFTQYTDTVYRVAVHNTDSEADAQDVAQDVFLKLYESSKTFGSEEHLKAWLIRVTLNLCRDRHRQSKRLQSVQEWQEDEAVYDYSSVLEAVKALPENYRNAIYLHYYEGYSAKEIAKITQTKQNTVLSWLKRGREILRKEMIGGFDDE